jgi:hypothetical protein
LIEREKTKELKFTQEKKRKKKKERKNSFQKLHDIVMRLRY